MNEQDQGTPPPLPLQPTDSGGGAIPGPVSTPVPQDQGGGADQGNGGMPEHLDPILNPEPQDGRQINSMAGLLGVDAAMMNPANRADRSPASGDAGGGHFEMDAEEMRTVRKQWEAFDKKVDDLRDDAQSLTNVEGPGNEQASSANADTCNESGATYQKYLADIGQYVKHYIKGLDKAIAALESTDQDNARDVGRQY